jgi:hypothetical protein
MLPTMAAQTLQGPLSGRRLAEISFSANLERRV